MSIQLSGGMAGLQFIIDILKLLADNWLIENGGERPEFVKQWEVKTIGEGQSNYSMVIAGIDSENPQIYSMLQGTADTKTSAYDWLHDVSITLDVRTGISESRVLEMVNEIMRIIKTNTVLAVNNNTYVQMLPEGLVSMNEEYRNMFRYLISVNVLKFNP